MSLSRDVLTAGLRGQNAAVTHFRDVDGAAEGDREPEDVLFNGAVSAKPAAVVACQDEAAIAAALRAATDASVPVSVVAGGHDLDGRAFGAGTLVLDLRGMSRVDVDTAGRTVSVQGGALTQHLLAALPDDLVAVTGTILTVGVTGLTLAGGYGRLNSRYGLASDNLQGARVVLADGSVVVAGPHDDSDLLWALRGGGSGFGVVSSLTLAAHRLPRVLTATILYPLDIASVVLRHVQDLLDSHPVELSVFLGFMTAPTGDRVLFVAPMWSGAPALGETLMEGLRAPAGALVLEQGWGPYKNSFNAETEKAWPKGRHYHLPTRTVRRIDKAVAEVLVDGARRLTSPHSAIVVHDFHGVACEPAPAATAFPLRENHFVVEVIGAWEPDGADDGARHTQWAEQLSGDLAPLALPGGYVNLLSPSDGDRVRAFYGASAQRLREIKRRVDPHDVFRSGIGRLDD